MRMSKGRCIGILLAAGLSCTLVLLVLFVVSPLLMLGLMMTGTLILALLWRFKPEVFEFMKCLSSKAEDPVLMDIESSLNREVFLTDMVLCSVNGIHEQIVHINKKLLVVGVAEGCDIVMPRDSGVSRIHAKVFYSNRDEQFLVEDNNSSNGTFLNNVRLVKGKPQILCKGDRLRFAKMEFVVKSAYYK